MLLLHIVHPVPMVTEGFENALVGPMPTDEAATRLLVTEGRAYLEREAATLVERGVKRVAGHVMVSAHTAKAIIALTKGWDPLGRQLPLLLFAVLVAGLIIYKHRGNIARLRAGTEGRFVKRET